MAIERRYPLHKLAAGDYLLLSNDGRTMWRLNRYQDGPSFGLKDEPRDRWLWRVLRWPETLTADTKLSRRYDLDDLSRWYEVASWLDTRREAVDYALSYDPRGGEAA